MPENNQIQNGFQPGYRLNKEIQQTTGNQIQENKKHSLWFTKILGVIFLLLGIGLIGLGIHDIFEISSSSSWYYSTYTIRDIIMKNGTWAFFIVGIIFTIIGIKNLFWGPKLHTSWFTKITSILFCLLGIGLISFFLYKFLTYNYKHYSEDYIELCIIILISLRFIIIGLLSYRTPDVEIYYHPTWLTKILSGIYRFLGVCLIRSGLCNFLLIGTPNLSFLKILYIGGTITLCGIFYILLGRLLYSTKSRLHLGFSLLSTLITNIIFIRILNTFSDHNYGYGFDNDFSQQFGILIILFTIIYFSISTIRWIIKCRKFNKKGIINPKYLDKTPSKKKLGIITTIVLFSLIIINLIYGKINWSKIPEINDSMFNRDYHQTKLPDEKDALVQLRNYNNGNINKVFEPLDSYYLYSLGNSYYLENNKDISWKQYPEECYVIYSGGNEYCGTWIWNKKTLDRVLNNYYYLGDNPYMEDFYDSDGYLSIDGKKVTIFEYIQKNEKEIRKVLQELDRIVSLDYYLPNDEILDLIPNYFQSQSRTSTIILSYYIYQEDWDMVMFIIKLNYKIIDIFNTSGSVLNQLISLVIQGIIDSSINSYIQLFPENLRDELSQRYSTQIYSEDEIFDKMIKGEYIMWNWAKAGNILGDVGYGDPSLSQFLFHFPFFSAKEINNLMNYSYYLFWKQKNDDNFNNITDKTIYNHSLYNRYGIYPYTALMPRMSSLNNRINKSLYHKEALIKNLESGKYDIRFNEPDWNNNPYEYENNRIPTETELIENKIKEYSDIIQPCLSTDFIESYEDINYYTEFLEICSQNYIEIKKQENDNFGLKEILTEISELLINYYEIQIKMNECNEEYIGDICTILFDQLIKNSDKINKSYIKLLNILDNIKEEFPEIDIDDYFYIPEIIYENLDYLKENNTVLDNLESEDIELNKSINKIKEYSNIIQPCLGKDIIDPKYSIGYYHDEFENNCKKTLSELENQENDNFGLKEILINITRLLINYSKIEREVDICWEDEIISDICEKNFEKEEKIIKKIKENYLKLSYIFKEINNNGGLGIYIDDYIYIPYEKIYDEDNLTLIIFNIDN